MSMLKGIIPIAVGIANGSYNKSNTLDLPDNRTATLQSKTSSSGTLGEGGKDNSVIFSKLASALGSTGGSGLGFKI